MLPLMPMGGRSIRQIQGTTPVPNFLLDKIMPRLRDTEWRLLSVIVRQTRGWQSENGERKEADWLSHFQLKRRTGRSGAAVSHGIDALVRRRLIIVRDLSGQTLQTPADRRRSRSRLSFSLNPEIDSSRFQERFRHARFQTLQTINYKRKLYKTKQQHRKRLDSVGSIRLKTPHHPAST